MNLRQSVQRLFFNCVGYYVCGNYESFRKESSHYTGLVLPESPFQPSETFNVYQKEQCIILLSTRLSKKTLTQISSRKVKEIYFPFLGTLAFNNFHWHIDNRLQITLFKSGRIKIRELRWI